MKKLITGTTKDIVHLFSLKKYAAACAIIAATCYIHYSGVFPFWCRGGVFAYSTTWYTCMFFLFFNAGLLLENGLRYTQNRYYYFLMIVAPLLFALKICLPYRYLLYPLPQNLQQAFQQPVSWLGGLLVTMFCLIVIHKLKEGRWCLYNTRKPVNLFSYLLFILMMLPLLVWASLQKDFDAVYPKAKIIAQYVQNPSFIDYLIFETAYACDFITIELFFRGFLVVSLGAIMGKQCVLPIALFYFSIHLEKPMVEAISSFFGGVILGVIAYNSKSIWGGWVVHVGIALLMELFAFLF